MKKIFLLGILVCCLTSHLETFNETITTQTSEDCGSGFQLSGTLCLMVVEEDVQYNKASHSCNTRGGKLVLLLTEKIFDNVQAYLREFLNLTKTNHFWVNQIEEPNQKPPFWPTKPNNDGNVFVAIVAQVSNVGVDFKLLHQSAQNASEVICEELRSDIYPSNYLS
ncbi:uncharacterized protein LOC143235574 [Tachypleus tridentatus]|uniref:uncharacterized protein LOC143235574 n=1 Tax=Tachypleus tridentatus TaxID=6853 RepID=UPI003FD61568